jgi:hypothetical protein
MEEGQPSTSRAHVAAYALPASSGTDRESGPVGRVRNEDYASLGVALRSFFT